LVDPRRQVVDLGEQHPREDRVMIIEAAGPSLI
jgi:hypothetical protein